MRVKLKDVAEIKFCLSNATKDDFAQKVKWVTPANLLENNVITDLNFDNKYRIDDNSKISVGDIIIKRISPSFVNYIDATENDVYASGNLIIIKASAVEKKYLAFLLSKKINKITEDCVGATIPAIGRSALENIQIPMLPIERQKAVGEIWYSNTKLQKLKNRLAELEKMKTEYLIDKYVKNEFGGNSSGK